MGHDQLFKQLFEAFFGDLMQLLVPEICPWLDVKAAEFLRGEHFTDVPEGDRREVDLLAKVPTQRPSNLPARAREDRESSDPESGQELILVHLEVEARASAGMGRRLRRYVQQIELRHELPVIPFVVYLKGGEPDVTSKLLREVVLDLELSTFRYFTFGLSPSDAEAYLRREQPLAWALAALMSRGNLRPAHHKLACLKRIAGSDTDPARRFLLVNCVETYLELPEADEEELETMIAETQNRDALEERLTWAEKIERRGERKGRLEGELKGLRASLLRLIERKFGPLSTATRSHVESLESRDRLYSLLDRVLTAETLEEMDLT